MKKKKSWKKKTFFTLNFALKILRFTDTIRTLVKQAQGVKRHCFKLFLYFL